eukprot:9432628-Ditylum_brightwellii.AAC.1
MKAVVRHSYEGKQKHKDLFPLWAWPLTTEGQGKSKYSHVAFAYSGARLAHGSYSPDQCC